MSTTSYKKRSLMSLLCLFFGVFGAHRFYAGRSVSASIQLLTLGGLGIWTTVDLLIILFGEFLDADGRKVSAWNPSGQMMSSS